MLNSENTEKILELLNISKRSNKYLYIPITIKPRSKKSITSTEKQEFIHEMITCMEKQRFTRLKCPVAIEIFVDSNTGNTPNIEKFTKNIIDLLYMEDNVPDDKLKFLPFYDDNQIKYIRTEYKSMSESPKGGIRIRRFSSLISDIKFVYNKSLTTIDQNIDYDDEIQNYYHIEKNKDKYTSLMSVESIEKMQNMNKQFAQRQFLSQTGISHNLIFQLYGINKKNQKSVRKSFHNYADFIINSPFHCILTNLPSSKIDRNEFKKEIEISFIEFKKKYQIFDELKGPVFITGFYKPPSRDRSFYKDLDNIMLDFICPVFNKVFRPPIGYFDLQTDSFHKSLDNSSTGYELLEIPNDFPEIANGFLSISFRMRDYSEETVFNIVDEAIEKYFDNDIRITRI